MQLYPITFAKDLIAELMAADQHESDTAETVSEPQETYETPQPEPAMQPEPQAKPELPKRQGTAKKLLLFKSLRWNSRRLIITKRRKDQGITLIC